MKYCEECGKEFETEDMICPVCNGKLDESLDNTEDATNEYEAAEIISSMMMNGII